MKKNTSPGMKRSRVPWSEKLRPEMEAVVCDDPKGRGKMLLPTPMLVAGAMRGIPARALLTVPELRNRMARSHGADLTCPLMTGIFYNIIAGAAEEEIAAGKPPLAPYWRVVQENGTLSPKTPAGPERQAEHLRGEGHVVEERRAKLHVRDFEQSLAD
ncbi:MGMT family protein [Luteolibacter marinus]|uniref:MGMT family protein n=1 Tax=Luteolibacter marinus TaxID=2776705 RepID=UPI0018663ABC|nr:MGMT family protein [Luteolibacter marinus]